MLDLCAKQGQQAGIFTAHCHRRVHFSPRTLAGIAIAHHIHVCLLSLSVDLPECEPLVFFPWRPGSEWRGPVHDSGLSRLAMRMPLQLQKSRAETERFKVPPLTHSGRWGMLSGSKARSRLYGPSRDGRRPTSISNDSGGGAIIPQSDTSALHHLPSVRILVYWPATQSTCARH